MTRLFPRPWLSVLLALAWLCLTRYVSLTTCAFALIAGVLIPLFLPRKPPATIRPLRFIAWGAVVFRDMLWGWWSALAAILREDTRPGEVVTFAHGLAHPDAQALLGWAASVTGGTLACRVTEVDITLHCAAWEGPVHAAARMRRYGRLLGQAVS